MTALLTDYTLRVVALGAGLLGALGGAIGSFAVLRREALLADGASHASLAGIVAAYLLTASRSTILLSVGAAVSAAVAAALATLVSRRTRIKPTTALAVMMSVFFGVGMVLMTYAQRLPGASSAGLSRFIYGEASSMLTRDVLAAALVGAILLAVLTLLYKELKLVTFDRAYAASVGYPSGVLSMLLTVSTLAVVVVSLQAVGAVLASALLVAPAVAARQWTHSLAGMATLAAVFGALSGVLGALASASAQSIPTGPAIVVAASVFAVASVLFAPRRGIVARLLIRIGGGERVGD